MIISKDTATAMGDLRNAEPGSVILIRHDARERKDWPRYLDAITSAVSRGADVRWVVR